MSLSNSHLSMELSEKYLLCHDRIMRSNRACTATWLVLSLAACAAPRNEHIATPAEVEMDGASLGKFQHEIEEYVELHQELLHRVPNVGPHASPAEIAAHRNKMTQGIVTERKGAHPGEIFKPRVEAAFRRLFGKELAR